MSLVPNDSPPLEKETPPTTTEPQEEGEKSSIVTTITPDKKETEIIQISIQQGPNSKQIGFMKLKMDVHVKCTNCSSLMRLEDAVVRRCSSKKAHDQYFCSRFSECGKRTYWGNKDCTTCGEEVICAFSEHFWFVFGVLIVGFAAILVLFMWGGLTFLFYSAATNIQQEVHRMRLQQHHAVPTEQPTPPSPILSGEALSPFIPEESIHFFYVANFCSSTQNALCYILSNSEEKEQGTVNGVRAWDLGIVNGDRIWDLGDLVIFFGKKNSQGIFTHVKELKRSKGYLRST